MMAAVKAALLVVVLTAVSCVSASEDVSHGVFAREAALQQAYCWHHGCEDQGRDARAAVNAYDSVLQDATWPLDAVAAAAACGKALLLESGGGPKSSGVEVDLPEAVRLYRQAAEAGNATAQFAMATLHALGMHGVPFDEARAIVLLRQAALGGDPAAQLAMGYRYYYGIGVPKQCSTAAVYYELAANAAVDATARVGVPTLNIRKRIADNYLDGFTATTGQSRDEEIVDYYEHTAELGDVSAQIGLAQLFYYGVQGVERNLTTAAKWFSRAAEEGDKSAQADLGHMYLHGLGVEVDEESAFTLITAAAEGHVASAVTALGYMHLTGTGVPESPTRALKLFKQAAESHDAAALYNLGVMKLLGMGSSREFAQAKKYFSRAAQRSHLQAQHNLGHMHLHGIGTAKSCPKAVKAFMNVAMRGPWVKQLDTAYHMLVDGRVNEALWQYSKAAEQGYEVAQWNAAFLLDRGIANAFTASHVTSVGHIIKPEPTSNVFPAASATLLPDGSVAVHDKAATASDATADSSTESSSDATADGNSDDAADSSEDGDDTTAQEAVEQVREVTEAQALRLFKRCSQQGNVAANLIVGDYHYYGRGGLTPDLKEAAQRYHTAANMRHPQAMFNLGYMHENGLGVKRDMHLAKRFYDMAIETNPKAYFAVKLMLYKLGALRWWQRLVSLEWTQFVGTGATEATEVDGADDAEPEKEVPEAVRVAQEAKDRRRGVTSGRATKKKQGTAARRAAARLQAFATSAVDTAASYTRDLQRLATYARQGELLQASDDPLLLRLVIAALALTGLALYIRQQAR